jgi:hypothetical protein
MRGSSTTLAGRAPGSGRGRGAKTSMLVLVLTGALGCKPDRDGGSIPGGRSLVESMVIEEAPEHLRGRVALPAGARVYARPTYASPSWTVRLPDPPAIASDSPPRTRAFRVIGVVRSVNSLTPEFLAITNDLDGDGQNPARGCGTRFVDLGHLRVLLYVPVVHVAEVTTRTLEVQPFSPSGEAEQLQVGAGARLGRRSPASGLPPLPSGSSWRWIDADGIRVLAPVPDDAVGQAWNPSDTPTLSGGGEQLLQDAEGSLLWLRDDGGSEVELGVRNDCGEHRRLVVDPHEVESLRGLALDVFYEQAPPREPEPVVQPDADYVIAGGTPLRWPDGELAGEVLEDWAVSVGVGQDWEGRRCFPLVLSGELEAFEEPGLACVSAEALTPVSGDDHFSTSDEFELGGSIELGPPEVLAGEWTVGALRPLLNDHHATVAECLRPMLGGDEPIPASRWVLMLIASADGRVSEAEVTPLGPTHDAVEDCLRAEAFTWLLPERGGQVLVPITLGPWEASLEAVREAEPEPKPKPKKGKGKSKPEPERGQVLIIRDEEPPEDGTSDEPPVEEAPE